MTGSLKGRLVLLTGGARGIGAAIREVLSEEGATVVAPSRALVDLSDRASVRSWIDENKTLAVDVLVNNAGINVLSPLLEISSSVHDEMLEVNLNSALALIQAFAPGMVERGWGRILNVSSIFSLTTKEKRASYSMTKAALNALTRSAAVEFGPGGVLTNSLAPGFVETELTRVNNTPEALASIAERIPLRRLAQPKEIARCAAFLVSEENTYLNGQVIVVDGGMNCL